MSRERNPERGKWPLARSSQRGPGRLRLEELKWPSERETAVADSRSAGRCGRRGHDVGSDLLEGLSLEQVRELCETLASLRRLLDAGDDETLLLRIARFLRAMPDGWVR